MKVLLYLIWMHYGKNNVLVMQFHETINLSCINRFWKRDCRVPFTTGANCRPLDHYVAGVSSARDFSWASIWFEPMQLSLRHDLVLNARHQLHFFLSSVTLFAFQTFIYIPIFFRFIDERTLLAVRRRSVTVM